MLTYTSSLLKLILLLSISTATKSQLYQKFDSSLGIKLPGLIRVTIQDNYTAYCLTYNGSKYSITSYDVSGRQPVYLHVSTSPLGLFQNYSYQFTDIYMWKNSTPQKLLLVTSAFYQIGLDTLKYAGGRLLDDAVFVKEVLQYSPSNQATFLDQNEQIWQFYMPNYTIYRTQTYAGPGPSFIKQDTHQKYLLYNHKPQGYMSIYHLSNKTLYVNKTLGYSATAGTFIQNQTIYVAATGNALSITFYFYNVSDSFSLIKSASIGMGISQEIINMVEISKIHYLVSQVAPDTLLCLNLIDTSSYFTKKYPGYEISKIKTFMDGEITIYETKQDQVLMMGLDPPQSSHPFCQYMTYVNKRLICTSIVDKPQTKRIVTAGQMVMSTPYLRVMAGFMASFFYINDEYGFYYYHNRNYSGMLLSSSFFTILKEINQNRLIPFGFVDEIQSFFERNLNFSSAFYKTNNNNTEFYLFQYDRENQYIEEEDRVFFLMNIKHVIVEYPLIVVGIAFFMRVMYWLFSYLYEKSQNNFCRKLNSMLENFFKKSSTIWVVMISILEMNLIVIVFYGARQMQQFFAFNFATHINALAAVFLIYVCLIYSLAFYETLFRLDKQLAKDFMGKNIGKSKFTLTNKVVREVYKSFLMGIVHGAFLENYLIQISLIIFIRICLLTLTLKDEHPQHPKAHKIYLIRIIVSIVFDLLLLGSYLVFEQSLTNIAFHHEYIEFTLIVVILLLVASEIVVQLGYSIRQTFRYLTKNQVFPDKDQENQTKIKKKEKKEEIIEKESQQSKPNNVTFQDHQLKDQNPNPNHKYWKGLENIKNAIQKQNERKKAQGNSKQKKDSNKKKSKKQQQKPQPKKVKIIIKNLRKDLNKQNLTINHAINPIKMQEDIHDLSQIQGKKQFKRKSRKRTQY